MNTFHAGLLTLVDIWQMLTKQSSRLRKEKSLLTHDIRLLKANSIFCPTKIMLQNCIKFFNSWSGYRWFRCCWTMHTSNVCCCNLYQYVIDQFSHSCRYPQSICASRHLCFAFKLTSIALARNLYPVHKKDRNCRDGKFTNNHTGNV